MHLNSHLACYFIKGAGLTSCAEVSCKSQPLCVFCSFLHAPSHTGAFPCLKDIPEGLKQEKAI